MRIDSIDLFRVPLAAGVADTADDRRESLVVALHSGEQVGYGEATLATAPREQAEWSAGAFALARDWLAPGLVGQSITTSSTLSEILDAFHGNRAAKSALDAAWWSLHAAQKQEPLARCLGGRTAALRVSPTLGVMDSIETLVKHIAASYAAGAELVLLKFRPTWGLEMVRAVRQAFPSEAIAIDCDGGCTLGQQEMFYRLEDFFLAHIEQPLPADDLVGHAMLQDSLRTPLCLHQSVTSLARAEQALDLGCCRMMRIAPALVGGLTTSLAIRAACEDARVTCGVGIAEQGPWATAAAAALASLPNFSLPADGLTYSDEPWIARDATGLPSIDLQQLAAHAIETATIG